MNFTIPQGHLPASDAMPVIEMDELEKIIFVVWKNQNNTLSYYCSYDDGTDDETGFVPLSVARSYPYVLFYPSIGHAPGSQRYEIVWREDWQSVPVEPRVFHQTVQVSTNNPPLSLTFLGDEEISNYWQDARQAPSVTVDMSGHPSVSWGAYDIYHGYIINFRQKLAAGWGTMATMIAPPNSDNDLYWAPSVSGFSNVQWQDGLRIAHNWTDNTDPQNPEYWIVVQRLQNGNWVEQDQTQDALHPNLTPFTTTNDILQVYPDESTVCGAGMNELFFTQANLQKRSNVLASQRELVIQKDTTFFLSRLGELVVQEGSNQTKLDWKTGFDTLVVGKTTTVGDYLRTKTFTVASNSMLKYRTVKTKRGNNVFPDSMYLRLQLVDASSNVVLTTLNTFHPRTVGRGRHDKRYVFGLKNYVGKNVYVRMILEGKDSTTSLSAINYYYDPDKYLPKPDGHNELGRTGNVSTYELSLNYPNPFGSGGRGVTEIHYSLSEPGDMRLAVYDMLGREVSVLVEGYQPAGKHTAHFKAGNLPAGLYLYRLSANGVQITRKMLIER